MLERRQFGKLVAALGATTAAGRADFAWARGPAVQVEGPIAGGRRNRIFGAHADDLAAHGYIEEEYFLSGTAESYTPVGTLGPDGLWTVAPGRQAPFKTRVIVQRPRESAKFNGTLICEWTNVSAGFEISSAVNQQFWKDGYAYASISAQRMGLEGTRSGRWD